MKPVARMLVQAGGFGLLWLSLMVNLYFLILQPRTVFSARRLAFGAVAAFLSALLLWLLKDRGLVGVGWRKISFKAWWIGLILAAVLFLIAPAPSLHSLLAPAEVRLKFEPADQEEAAFHLIWLNNGLGDLSFNELDLPSEAEVTPQGIFLTARQNQPAEIRWRGRIWGELQATIRSETPLRVIAQAGNRITETILAGGGGERSLRLPYLSPAHYAVGYLLAIVMASFSLAWLGQVGLDGLRRIHQRLPALWGKLMRYLPTVSLVGVGVFYLLTLRSGHPWGDDFAQYLAHARNLATGQPYTAIGILDNPAVVLGPSAYPPLFPLLLAPFYAVFGLNWTVFQLIGVACALGALWLFDLWLKPRFQPALRSLAVLLAGLHPWFWDYKDQILSDMPFALLGMLALVGWERWRDSETGVKGWVIGLAIAAAIAARSVGLILLAAVLADAVLRRGWRRRDFPFILGIPLAALLALNVLLPSTGDYLGQLRGWNETVLGHNLGEMKTTFLQMWRSDRLPIGQASLISILGLSLLGLGAVLRLRRIGAAEFYLLGTVVMIALWPHPQGFRFFLPVFFFLIGYALEGWERLRGEMKGLLHPKFKGWGVGFAWLILAGLAAGMLEGYWKDYRRLPLQAFQQGIGLPASQAMFEYLRAETQPEDVIAFFKPRALALITERTAFAPYWNPQQPQRFVEDLAAFQPDYVVVWKPDYGDLAAFARSHSSVFNLSFENEDFEIYSIADLQP